MGLRVLPPAALRDVSTIQPRTVKPAQFQEKSSFMAKTIPTKPIDRSAVNGQFVTHEYAIRHPRTTEHERVPISNPKK